MSKVIDKYIEDTKKRIKLLDKIEIVEYNKYFEMFNVYILDCGNEERREIEKSIECIIKYGHTYTDVKQLSNVNSNKILNKYCFCLSFKLDIASIEIELKRKIGLKELIK